MRKKILMELRDQFSDWCWSLSIDELASNAVLMDAIEDLETLLVLSCT